MKCRLSTAVLTCTAFLVLMCAAPVGAEELLTRNQANSHGPLDGMSFSGKLGPADGNGDRKNDTLYFRDGHFWSALCVPCGFRPGRYWVHRAGDQVHFRGTLSSPENGTFLFTGIVEDDRISVTLDWRKERWYWTVSREFRFEGELRDGDASFATIGDARSTATSALEAGSICEPG